MKIYLAANYSRYPEMQLVKKKIESIGHKVTSRWILGEHEALEGQSHALNRSFANDDWDDLINSNICLWFSNEEGKENRGRGGRHVEFGLALAWHIPIYVVGRKENVFHWLEQVTHINSVDEFLILLQGKKLPLS